MNKNQLKTGYRVTVREGLQYIVLRGFGSTYTERSDENPSDVMVCLQPGVYSWLILDNYRHDLVIDMFEVKALDIMKVEEPGHPYDIFYHHDGWNVLWEKKE
jgi:hypothetical protein